MGFIKDFFSPLPPCDICSFTLNPWPRDRTGVTAWTVIGGGLNVEFLICRHCSAAIQQSGLAHKNPTLVMGYLISRGIVERPPAHAYLQHDAWRRVWMHTLETLRIPSIDEFQALAAIKAYEQAILDGFDGVAPP